MTVLDILTYPDKFLKQQTASVQNIDGALQTIFDNMATTMYAAPGIGLAAPQVGIGQSFIIYDIAPQEEGRDLHILVNPKIITREGEILSENEGCLSVPDYRADVKRYARVIVKAQDRDGNPIDISRMLAVCDKTVYIERCSLTTVKDIKKSKKAMTQVNALAPRPTGRSGTAFRAAGPRENQALVPSGIASANCLQWYPVCSCGDCRPGPGNPARARWQYWRVRPWPAVFR